MPPQIPYIASSNAKKLAGVAIDTTTPSDGFALVYDLASNTYKPTAVAAGGSYVPSSLFDAHTILQATVDNTPAALTVAEQRIVGRKTGGNIAALTAAEVRTLTNVAEIGDKLSISAVSDSGIQKMLNIGNVTSTTSTATVVAAVNVTGINDTLFLDVYDIVNNAPVAGDVGALRANDITLGLNGVAYLAEANDITGNNAYGTKINGIDGGTAIGHYIGTILGSSEATLLKAVTVRADGVSNDVEAVSIGSVISDGGDAYAIKIDTITAAGGTPWAFHFPTNSSGQVGILNLASGTTVNEFSIDGTLAGDSDDAVPTEKAVKAYADSIIVTPGGADTQLQWNNAGAFGGISQITWNSGSSLLSLVGANLDPQGASTTCVQLGNGASASSTESTAVGRSAAATTESVAFGRTAVASQPFTTALGKGTVADQQYSIALGHSANTDATNQLMIGATDKVSAVKFGTGAHTVTWTNPLTFALGTSVNEFSIDGTLAGDSDDAVPTEKAVKAYVDASSTAPGGSSTELQYNNAGAFGGIANAKFDGTDLTIYTGTNLVPEGSGSGSTELGQGADASGSNNICIGSSAASDKDNCVVIGTGATANSGYGQNVAIGVGATISGGGVAEIALGYQASTSGPGMISIGSTGIYKVNKVEFGDRSHEVQWLNSMYISSSKTLRFDSGATIGEFSIDGTLAGDSDTALPTEKAVKTYVDTNISAVSGSIDWKDAVDTAATSNITLSGEQTLNGVLTSTSRVAVVAQSAGAENGIYTTGAGAWTRTTDADSDAEVTQGMSFYVMNASSDVDGYQYLLTTADPITVGTTALVFTSLPPISSAVMNSAYTAADEVMVGTGAGTHTQVTLGASEFLAKKAAGAATNVTAAEARTILNVEDGADVTDATNVAAAGATMDADTSLVGNGYFLDDDTMSADDATKVASQQSIKAYVDASSTAPGGATTNIQYNNAGAFGGSANLTFDGTTLDVGVEEIKLGSSNQWTLDRISSSGLAFKSGSATTVDFWLQNNAGAKVVYFDSDTTAGLDVSTAGGTTTFSDSTASSSSITGAVVVTGGVGISGAVYLGSGGIVFDTGVGVAIGGDAQAATIVGTHGESVAIGAGASITVAGSTSRSVVIGHDATAQEGASSSGGSVAVGFGADGNRDGTAIGTGATCGNQSTVIGYHAGAGSFNCAFGNSASANQSGDGQIALGYDATTDRDNQLMIGDAGTTGGRGVVEYMKFGSGSLDITFENQMVFSSGIRVKHSTADVSNPPTDAQLDSEFGTPATVGSGFFATLDDAGSGATMYLIASDGTNWWHSAMTKAV